MITIKYIDLAGMADLAKTDPGMNDLLAQALEYYILKGKPPALETPAEREIKIMHERYGL